MRGSTADVRERQRPYVDDFRDAAPVLDVGCGRGEFLVAAPRGGHRGARRRRRRRHGRLRARRGARRRAGRRARLPRGLSTTARSAGSSPRRSSSTCRRPARPAARARGARSSAPAALLVAETINPLSPLALAQLLRRPDARAAARPRDARAARAAGGLPRGRRPRYLNAPTDHSRCLTTCSIARTSAAERAPLRRRSTTRSSPAREDRRLPPAGAVRARRRRDLHGRPRRRAARARPRGRPRHACRSSGTRASAC